MKTWNLTLASFFISLALLSPAQAGDRAVGTLAGTAAGLVAANNVQGLSPWVAVPAGALAGNYIASRYYRADRSDYRSRTAVPYSRRYYDDYEYSRGYRPDPFYAYSPPKAASRPAKTARKIKIQPTTDLQPGVDLIKVSILNSNGLRTDVQILRVKNKFIGPQGEEYDSLPTSEALAQLYGM